MSRLKKFKEQKKKLSRFQALKSIFSSLLITITAVVIVTVVIPKSPEAAIENLEAFNNAVTYTINVTDSDNAIIEDTLKVTLENQFEEYVTYLNIGSNIGVFLDLKVDTEYMIKVLADKGFGLEVLDSQTISTYPVAGGILISTEIDDQTEINISYKIQYLINDIFDEYKNVQVRYGFKYPGSDDVYHYQIIPISINETSFILEGADSNLEVFVYLEAITQEDVTVILDELVYSTPFELYGSLYPNRVSHTSAEFMVWVEHSPRLEVEYEVILKKHDYIIERKSIEVEENEDQFHEGGNLIEFSNLTTDQEYKVVLVAKYIDPVTLEYSEVEVSEVDFKTLPDFEANVTVTDNETYFEVTINLSGSQDTYDQAYYVIWEVNEFGTWVYESMSYDFEVNGDESTISFILSVPVLDEMFIDIGIIDSTEFYYKVILETLNNTEEVIG